MSHTPHELAEDFAANADDVARLKSSNAHFARLADRYHTLNRTIHRAETGVEPTDDFHMQDLRKERMVLKDEIAQMLKEA